jgi:hypothetical protein
MSRELPASQRLVEICLEAANDIGPGADNPGGLSDTCREILRQVARRFDGRSLDIPPPADPELPSAVARALGRIRASDGLGLDDTEFVNVEFLHCHDSDVLQPGCLSDLLEAMLSDSAAARSLRGGLGAFYTPTSEVLQLCRLLLLAQLTQRLADAPEAVEVVRRLLLPSPPDASPPDASPPDASPPDASPPDATPLDPALRIQPTTSALYRQVEDALATISWCDPACGGGNFLAAAASVVENLQSNMLTEVQERATIRLGDSVDQRLPRSCMNARSSAGPMGTRLPFLAGMDRMVEAVAVTRFRLESIQDVTWERPFSVLHGDTLELLAAVPEAVEQRAWERLGARDGFDIVVGNPPYVRHERFEDSGGLTKTGLADGVRHQFPELSGRKLGRLDLYAWFFPLAALLLRPGGHVGYVVSDSWLDSEGGEVLRTFLSTRLHTRMVLQDPARRSFSRAGVSTAITIAQKPLTAGLPGGVMGAGTARWGPSLRVSPVIAELLATDRLVELGSVARLAYGNKPGIRDFFVLRRIGEESRGIESVFLMPIVTTARDLSSGEVDPQRLSCVAFVCPYTMADLEAMPAAAGALAWIRIGEGRVTRTGARHTRGGIPWPQARSVRNRPGGWYRFVPRPGLDFLVPCLLGNRFLLPANPHRLPATNQFFHGGFVHPEDRALGLALLQSTVTWRLIEWFGRRKGLGGLNLYGYDLEQLPFPAPGTIPQRSAREILAAFEPLRVRRLLPAQEEVGHGDPNHAPPDRVRLDEAVLSALGLPPAFLPRLYRDFAEAVEMRVRKGRGEE